MNHVRRGPSLVGAIAALALVAAACGGGSDGSLPGQPDSIDQLKEGATPLSLLGAQSALTSGTDLFAFGLVTQDGNLLGGGSPEVWVAKDGSSQPIGPFRATSYDFTAYEKFADQSPISDLTSFYTATVNIPEPGNWAVAATLPGSLGGVGTAFVQVVPPEQAPFPLGSRALSTPTPVATSNSEARQICTRLPKPDPMHYISLDKALGNGKPTVVTFATPLLCESRICGPVVDEVFQVYETVGKSRANFIHVEEFLPGPDLEPPPATLENRAPAFKAWRLATEPWTFVIDRDGIIRARFEGPVVATQIQAALQQLL